MQVELTQVELTQVGTDAGRTNTGSAIESLESSEYRSMRTYNEMM